MSPRLGQAGAASLTMIVAISLAIIFAALAVDTGRLGLESKRLQNIADLAAIDALSEAGLCSGVTAIDRSAVEAAAVASAARNGFGNDPTGVEVRLGTLGTEGGLHVFHAAAGGDINAVEVSVVRNVTSSLIAGGWLGGQTPLQRRAVAYDEVLGAFSAGSELASLDNDGVHVFNALLGALLGGVVSITDTGYEQLFDAEVKLDDLAEAAASLGVGSGDVSGFLQATVSPGQFLRILAAAVTNSDPAYADISALATVTTNTDTIALDDLISVPDGNPQVAAAGRLNVLDLITGSAQLFNKGGTVSMAAGVNLPQGLSGVAVDLHVLEGPKYAIGPPGVDATGAWRTQVRSAKLQLVIKVPLDAATPILGGAVRVSGTLPLYIDALSNRAWLETIRCANAASVAHRIVIGARTDGAELGIGQFDDIGDPASATSPPAPLTLELSGGLVSMDAEVAATLQSAAVGDTRFNFVAAKASPLPQTQSSEVAPGRALTLALGGLAGSLSATVTGGGGLTATLALAGLSTADLSGGLVDELLSPLVLALDQRLIVPLLQALGVRFGAVDITLHSVERNDPRLKH